MKLRPMVAAKVGWLAMATGILVFTFYLYDGTPVTHDAELILLYGMLALSFPVSQLVALILGSVGYIAEKWGVGLSIPMSYMTLVVEWLVFLGAGYLQWFVLLPWLWRKWKSRRARSAIPHV